MNRVFQLLCISLTVLGLFACGMKFNGQKLDFQDAELQPQLDRMLRQILITESLEIQLDNRQKFRLSEDSRWQMVGRLPIGGVYRPTNTTLVIEEDQVYDAYLIVSEENSQLHGFYFPARKAYVQLEPPVTLKIQR